MKLIQKRALVLFSVALNIGFVIVAGTLIARHSHSDHDHKWTEVTGIVQGLGLPPDREKEVIACMERFRSTVDRVDQDLHRARGDIISLLARKGPVDREQLHRLVVEANRFGKLKSEVFEVHFLELRQLMGDEKGAMFFSLLKKQKKPSDKPHHR